MDKKDNITIEIAYALPTKQSLLTLHVAIGTTVLDAIHQSGILTLYPEINLKQHAVGIFGKRCTLDHRVQSGDRIEIYRSLIIDPKTARRERAKKT